jgi:hypothetical protein
MHYRIGFLLLALIVLALLWARKVRAALGITGLIAVMSAVGFLVVGLIRLPASP